MANKILADFVQKSMEHGQDRENITNALNQAGWKTNEVQDALALFSDVDYPIAVPKPQPYRSARIAFLYLLFFIMLGVISISLGNLLFALIETLFPDAAKPSDYIQIRNERQIRSGISGLIVGAPIFFFLARMLSKARQKDPELQRSQIRKWLTYLTLVIAGSTLVGDAISLVYNLLDGEMTTRFLLKSLVIALIAGVIFIYFIKDAERGDEGQNHAG